MPQKSVTRRETEILKLIALGYRNRDIAAACRISEQTVKNHVYMVMRKLGVKNRTQAATMAIKAGLQRLDGVDINRNSLKDSLDVSPV